MSNAKDFFIDVPAGATVYKLGDSASDMYIIESGQIDFHKPGTDEALDSFGPGDFFGEMAMIEEQPRRVTAMAKTASRLLRIERAAFADVLRQNVDIAIKIMRRMVARQRRTDQRLQDTIADLVKVKGAATARPSAAPVSATAQPARAVSEPAPMPAAKVEAAAAKPVPAVAKAAAQNMVLRHESGKVLALDAARTEFLIGRPDPVTGTTPELDLGAFDANRTLSRRHAKILRDGAVYFVHDEGGANGTFVNGERVNAGASVAIKPGDKLRFGSVEVELGVA